jgi:hypothetical protein
LGDSLQLAAVIFNWALDLEAPFDERADMFRLVKIERQKTKYAYVYGIERGVIGSKRKNQSF